MLQFRHDLRDCLEPHAGQNFTFLPLGSAMLHCLHVATFGTAAGGSMAGAALRVAGSGMAVASRVSRGGGIANCLDDGV